MWHRMASLPVTFSDLEGHLYSLEHFCLTYLGKYSVYYLRYVYTDELNRRVACNLRRDFH